MRIAMFARSVLVSILTLALCSAAMAQSPTKSTTSEKGDKADQKKRKAAAPKNLAIKAMKTVIKNAEFKEMAFEDFVEWLGRKTKANIVVRWQILEKAGVERDYPIILKRKNITIRDLLPLVFRQVTEDLRDVELSAKAGGNTLVISTSKDIKAKLLLKTYDIQDLLVTIPNFAGIMVFDPESGRRGGCRVRTCVRGSGGGGSQARTENSPQNQPQGDIPKPARKLIDIITTQIRPLSWRVNGGRGTILYFKGRLVVRNTYEVHEMIGGPV